MINGRDKLGVFIVPTGIGAAIGGYAGDASCYARKFSKLAKLIVNPNVVNAGGFSGINDNMFYVEGYSLDEFFKGNINLQPSVSNRIGIVFDKAIPSDVLNVHINTINAVKTVYGIDICGYDVTLKEAGVEFNLNSDGVSSGSVKNIETLIASAKKLIANGAEAIAVVCMFDNPEDMNEDYANGEGTDPVGGVEAIISHCMSKALNVPVAHSPAFADYSISSEIVNPKSSSEYITPTFLPCVLLGLSSAPKLVNTGGIGINNVDFLVMPYDSLGCVPVFEALKKNIPVYVIKENTTALNVTNKLLHKSDNIREFETYDECYKFLSLL